METIKKVIVVVMMCGLIYLSGCAAGAATAGYSMRAKTADELSPAAEQRLTERIMREVKLWHDSQTIK